MISYQYLAGFFDGDGVINVANSQQGKWYSLKLALTNSNKPFLEKVQKQFGGRLWVHGKPGNEYTKYNYNLVWHGQEAKKIAAKLLPYSIIKQEQLKIALNFPIGSQGSGPIKMGKQDRMTQKRIYEKLIELKHKT